MILACSRAVLWVAVLLYACHAGASLYEMLVVTPQWATDSAQSVRDWSVTAKAVIRPMAYKEPAVLALGAVSLVMSWLSIWRTTARGWMMLAGILGLVLVGTSILFAFPFLERTLLNGGAGLSDQDIEQQLQTWQMWCSARLALLLIAWAASLMALLRASGLSGPSRHGSIRL